MDQRRRISKCLRGNQVRVLVFLAGALIVNVMVLFPHLLHQQQSLNRTLTTEMDAPFPTTQTRVVHFLDPKQLDPNYDYFSATWIQPVDKFLALDTEKVHTVEGGCFAVFHANPLTMRMTLDWMDFSVEHLSKWWKILGVLDSPDSIPFNSTMTILRKYIHNIRLNGSPTMQTTITIIAFQPWKSKLKANAQKGRTLTITSLAATLASLLQAGFGRVVIVGQEGDSAFAQEAFQLLLDEFNMKTSSPITRIGPMEVGFAHTTAKEVNSTFIPINIVKGALVGLQAAFQGSLSDMRTREWLGTTHDKSYWKYVYLTEPDTILQTRPSALPQLRDALDKELVLAPHRLQPIPHESNVMGMKNIRRFVPGDFKQVVELNPLDGGVCCDELAGTYKPWKDMESCGTFWWQCGFSMRRDHSRLEAYQLMRLKTGTGIVSLAGTEHGRRCIPRVDSVCEPPSSTQQ